MNPHFEAQLLSLGKDTEFLIKLPVFKKGRSLYAIFMLHLSMDYFFVKWSFGKKNRNVSEHVQSMKISTKIKTIILSMILNILRGEPIEKTTLMSS